MLPCIAAVAIATTFGTKAFKSNASEYSLLMANIEALSAGESDQLTKVDCQWAKNETCVKMDPYDPSKDKEVPDHRWKP